MSRGNSERPPDRISAALQQNGLPAISEPRVDGPGITWETFCMIRVVLAQPRGFCAGVERAIEIVERALEKYGPPIYVRHEIVHNRHVVERLRAKGAQFVDEID